MPATGLESRDVPPAPTGLVAVDGRTFPMKGAAIRARAAAGLAHTTFGQRYANPHAEPLEVLYTLPLPADGAVVGYTIHIGDKIIRGHVETCENAQETYRRALSAGRVAGLLAQERADTFTQKLGSLPPGAEVRVEVDVLHPLGFHPALETSRAEWEYRFPTVVGVRYQGAAGRVPDADRLDVERADGSGIPARLSLELTITDGDHDALAPRSPSHFIMVAGGDDARGEDGVPFGQRTVVRFDEPARLDRDVVITWQAGAEALEARLVMGPGLAGDDGRYGLLTITPPLSAPAFARDLTILIDASGSMSGEPLAAAKAVASQLLRSLAPDDRFEILAFAMDATTLVGGPVNASGENIVRAIERLAALEAGGGTEMADAIRSTLSPLRSDSLRQVVLLSDGYVGFENEVVAHVLQNLPAGARLHTVGIGHSPNRSLTRAAARAGRGIELLVAGRHDLDRATSRLLAATVSPLLTDLEISGSALIGHAPARAQDVLAGEPLRMAMAFAPHGGELVVRGRQSGKAQTWEQRWTVPAGDGADLDGSTQIPIGALYGREAIEDEEMRLAAAGSLAARQAQESLEHIEALGLRHRIASRRTSLVAVAEDPTVDPRDPRRRVRLAVELPHGMSAEGVGLAGGAVWHRFAARVAGGEPEALQFLTLPGAEAQYRLRATHHFRRVETRPDRQMRCRRRPRQAIHARCIRLDGDLLVIEFESPGEFFRPPAKRTRITVQLADGERVEARVDEKLSTRAKPFTAGLTLRLALRTQDRKPWPDAPRSVVWERDRLLFDLEVAMVPGG